MCRAGLSTAEEADLPLRPQAVALSADVEDVAVVKQPIQDGSGDHRVTQELASQW